MKQRANGQSNGITGVLFRAGKKWRGLIAETNGQKPQLIAWEEFDASRLSRIDSWLAKNGATSVIGILPASCVICRTCSLPDANQTQLDLALQLQAESHLTDSSAQHRQAMAVLENAPGETNRTGIMVSWPQTAQFEVPAINLPVRYAPDIAALAALLNGHRPSSPLLWLNQTDGTVALAITHAAGAAFRATRELAKTAEQWQSGVARILAETALDAGHTSIFTETLVDTTKAIVKTHDGNSAVLIAPIEIFKQAEQRVQGVPAEDGWWQAYGLAVGILLANSSQLAPLTKLQQDAPVISPSLVSRLSSHFSNRKTTSAIITSCMIIVAIWPLVAARIRLTAYELKFPNLNELEVQAQQEVAKLVMYQELRKHAWPMTKLLSDIACNTPRGVDIEMIDLKHVGQRLIISGTTKPNDGLSAQEVVTLMQENLRKTGIFSEIYLTWGDSNNYNAYEFTLTSKIVQPFRIHDYPIELDFAAWTLSDRLYKPDLKPGESQNSGDLASADNTMTEESQHVEVASDTSRTNSDTLIKQPSETNTNSTDSQKDPTRTARLPRNRNPRNPGGPLGVDQRSDVGVVPPSARDIPEPLSSGQIDVLTSDEVNEAISKIATALQRGHPDDETKIRLREEFRLLYARKRALQ